MNKQREDTEHTDDSQNFVPSVISPHALPILGTSCGLKMSNSDEP